MTIEFSELADKSCLSVPTDSFSCTIIVKLQAVGGQRPTRDTFIRKLKTHPTLPSGDPTHPCGSLKLAKGQDL